MTTDLKTRILLGPPGTGKTHSLLDIMEQEMRSGVDSKRVGFMAFTRRAAEIAKSRAMEKFALSDNDLPFFRTLHSLAFRQLGIKRDQVMQWNHYKELGEKLGMQLRANKNVEDGTTYGMTKEERMMFLEGLSRILRKNLQQIWGEADEEEIDWWEIERFSRALKEYKAARLVLDYTDMIELFVEQHASAAPDLDVLIIDEAQDISPIQWLAVDKLASKAKRVYMAGDDDQCQPPGTMVETTMGSIPIECLDPTRHRLLSWRRDTHLVHVNHTGGFSFTVAKRWYDGPMMSVTADENTTDCTPDHLWYVRFKKSVQEDRTKRAVYLMKKGDWYRIGECQLFGPQGGFHLWVRSRVEQADAVWIIDIVNSREEAKVLEEIISSKFGIPQIVFNPTSARSNLTKEATNKIFESLDTRSAARNCLSSHGLNLQHPFFTPRRAQSKRGGTPIFELETCNIKSGLMEIPLPNAQEWGSVEISSRSYSGFVFSLNVEPHHTYIADGLVTKNCIYKWAGADVQHFIDLEGDVRVLDQSHRIPSSVHFLAESITKQITKRRLKQYKPRANAGSVHWYGDSEEVDLAKGTWLLLARNGYLLSGLEEMCIRNGFSFESVSHSPMKSESLKAIKSWENLRKGNAVPIEEAMMIVKFVTPGKGVKKNSQEALKRADQETFVTMEELSSNYGFKSNSIWHEFMDRIPSSEKEYFIAARKRGETLTRKPRITISTIHAAKGGEAENVMLLTDMSYRTFCEMQKFPDDENRVWYVAVTRCSEALHMISPKTNLCYEFS